MTVRFSSIFIFEHIHDLRLKAIHIIIRTDNDHNVAGVHHVHGCRRYDDAGLFIQGHHADTVTNPRIELAKRFPSMQSVTVISTIR